MMSKKESLKEKIIYDLIDHWIVLCRPLLLLIIGTGLTVVCYILGKEIGGNNEILGYSLLILACCTMLVSAHWFFIHLFSLLLSKFYVGSERLVVFDFLPFARDDVTFVNIDEIHEIEENQHGVLPNILGYGDISINLSAVSSPVYLHYVPLPSKVVNIIEAIREGRLFNEIEVDTLRGLYKRKIKFSAKKKRK
jgi:hypothetical protein